MHFYADEILEVVEPGIELSKNAETFFEFCAGDEAAVVGECSPPCNFGGDGNLHFYYITINRYRFARCYFRLGIPYNHASTVLKREEVILDDSWLYLFWIGY